MARKPLPAVLNNLKGDAGKRRRNLIEPTPSSEIPDCPDHLKGVARNQWFIITEKLESMGLLSATDENAIAGYCISYAVWKDAADHIQTEPLLTEVGQNGYMGQNPYLAIMNKQRIAMDRFETDFGMTPSARAKCAVKAEKPVDAATKYFSGPPSMKIAN